MQTFSAMWSEELGAAVTKAAPEHYPMELNRDDALAVRTAVNQGIDGHLEACNAPHRGDAYDWDGRRLNCQVSRESLPTLVRRLMEAGDGRGLASSICENLEIELI